MRSKIFRVFAVLGLAGAMAAACLAGESLPGVKVTIPFAFRAGTVNLPAGTYEIKQVSAPYLMGLTNTDTLETVLFQAMAGSTTGGGDKAYIRFNRYGNERFLSKISIPGRYAERFVVPGKHERELAAKTGYPSAVEVAIVR